MTEQAAQVFLSYKSEDRRRVKPLVDALQTEGFCVWWDAEIGAGKNWQDEIEQHLDAAKCVVVAWTKRSVGADGHFVRDEARRAQRHGAYLPVCLDAVEPPLGFGETQALPLTKWKGDRGDPRFKALADAVRDCLAGKLATARPVEVNRPTLSRRTIIAGAAGTAVIAGAGGWALLRSGRAAASNRIAVMDFANMSGDPAQSYFSDGIAEELRSALTRIGMQVIGKGSCDAVKDLAIPAAAAKLGVANILTGRVRRSPATIRIGATLVNGADGVEKWTQTYDRAPGDTIKIQTDIAAQVAGALQVALGVAKTAALRLGGTADPVAQDLYLQALALNNSADSPEVMKGVLKLLDQAIARDSSYGDAQLQKARSLEGFGVQYANSPAELARAAGLAKQAARRAAALMPGSARVAALFAILSADDLDFGASLRGFKQALAAQPNDVTVLRTALNILPWVLDGPFALSAADRAIELDPLNPSTYAPRGVCLYALRRYEEAVAAFSKAVALGPQLSFPRIFLSHSLVMLNRDGDAAAILEKMAAGDLYRQTDEAIIAARRGNKAGAQAAVGKLRASFGDTDSTQYAQIYAQLGDADSAFAALNRAVEVRDAGIAYLKRDPLFDPIRRDPRYGALLTKLNFP